MKRGEIRKRVEERRRKNRERDTEWRIWKGGGGGKKGRKVLGGRKRT